mmetsp:Transcript_58808/g.140022  ORF Transcript_58808/g.140022 Transcript_58808/m.140022 type:complete len:227 (-) Transcript_58808:26-706(-)
MPLLEIWWRTARLPRGARQTSGASLPGLPLLSCQTADAHDARVPDDGGPCGPLGARASRRARGAPPPPVAIAPINARHHHRRLARWGRWALHVRGIQVLERFHDLRALRISLGRVPSEGFGRDVVWDLDGHGSCFLQCLCLRLRVRCVLLHLCQRSTCALRGPAHQVVAHAHSHAAISLEFKVDVLRWGRCTHLEQSSSCDHAEYHCKVLKLWNAHTPSRHTRQRT